MFPRCVARSCPTARIGETAAAPQHVVGRLLPAKGVLCLVPHARWDTEEVTGSSASLEGLSRLVPLGAPQALQVVRPNEPQKLPPLALQLACLGCCSLLPFACFLVFFCRALNCQLLFPDVSLWFSPCLAALLKIAGVKIPHRWCLRAAPVSLP